MISGLTEELLSREKSESLNGITVIQSSRMSGKTTMLYDLMIGMAKEHYKEGNVFVPSYLFLVPDRNSYFINTKDNIRKHIAIDEVILNTGNKFVILGKNFSGLPVYISVFKESRNSRDKGLSFFFDGIFIDEADYMGSYFLHGLYRYITSEYTFVTGTPKMLTLQQDSLMGTLTLESYENNDIEIIMNR